MAKIEIDILDSALDNSGDGEGDVLGMVDEGSFGSGGDDKNHVSFQNFMDSGEDDHENYNDSCSKLATNAVTYRLVNLEVENTNTTVSSSPIFNTPGGATIERSGPQPVQTVLANPVNGQLFVIGNSNDMYIAPGSKTIIPRETNSKANVKRRDDRRRATHNEVERRRRDKINNWILRLSKIIPPSQDEKSGSENQSKGGILAKACEYIIDLKNSQQRFKDMSKDNELMALELIKLNQQLLYLRSENTSLRKQLTQNGIVPEDEFHDAS